MKERKRGRGLISSICRLLIMFTISFGRNGECVLCLMLLRCDGGGDDETRWKTDPESDMEFWRRFPCFTTLETDLSAKKSLAEDDTTASKLARCRYQFLRLKELFIVESPASPGFSIGGLYYLCYDRISRVMAGYYFCEMNRPVYQQIVLRPVFENKSAASTYHFA